MSVFDDLFQVDPLSLPDLGPPRGPDDEDEEGGGDQMQQMMRLGSMVANALTQPAPEERGSDPPPVPLWVWEEMFRRLCEANPGALEETWWLLEQEADDFSDIMEKAGESLDRFFEYYNLYPIRFEGKCKLFLARYDFPQNSKEIQHPDGRLKNVGKCLGFIDFLGGFPLQNPELLTSIGEYSSRKEKNEGEVAAKSGGGQPVPPIPDDLFEGYDDKRMLLNYFYLDEEHAETLADDLAGEPKPEGLHWWVRINLEEDKKYPVPGEFLALAARQWCTLPWGEQESTPYLFSGNWMDTVFYTGGRVESIDESGDFPRYQVRWRKHLLTLNPSDFAEYQVGDRVTILKKVPEDKQSQLWKDDDTETPDEEKWVVAPLMFYGIKARGDGQE